MLGLSENSRASGLCPGYMHRHSPWLHSTVFSSLRTVLGGGLTLKQAKDAIVMPRRRLWGLVILDLAGLVYKSELGKIPHMST